MGHCCLKLLGVASVIGAIGIGLFWNCITQVPDLPDIPLGYWGPGSAKPDDTKIKPFVIDIPEFAVKDFEARLDNTRELVEPLEGIGFEYGFNTAYLKELIAFWKKDYKWTERQTFLNKFPQFKTQIGGLNIHFIHVKPDAAKAKGKQVVPIILLHGWPGSVREFYEVIPLLTAVDPKSNIVYEVVVPSLPGYGWSDASKRPDMGPLQMANIFKELMIRLGYNKFVVQGGDWGALIGAALATLHPENVIAYHSNMCGSMSKVNFLQTIAAALFPSYIVEEHMADRYRSQFAHIIEESGYFHIQATKPDTIGVALTDSPVGLAAYILEKFSTWTHKSWKNLPNGGLDNWDKKAILDNIMIYWYSKSITTSMRLYSEAFSAKSRSYDFDEIPVTVPTGCARFDQELAYQTTSMLRTKYKDLVQVTDYPKGGHFAALEVPKIFTDDVTQFVKTVLSRKPNKQ